MELTIKYTPLEKQRAACIIVGIYESRQLSASAQILNSISEGYLDKILSTGDMDGQKGSTLLLHHVPHITSERVLLVGLGKAESLDGKTWLTAMQSAITALFASAANTAAFYCLDETVAEHSNEWKIEQLALLLRAQAFLPGKLKKKPEIPAKIPKKISFVVAENESSAAKATLDLAVAIANGMELAKDLGNLPGNICTPEYLAGQAKKLAKEFQLDCEILERKDMEKLGMNALLAVAQGSSQPPKFILVHYRGGKSAQAPIVLVGKGITFDAGGISLKPAAEMDEMKYDMGGAASVLGALHACATLKLPINLTIAIPSCENLPDGMAVKPGDIVTTMSGQTVEILNTDAEGRLILCDALTYVERFKPAVVIDVATLTGACVIALGHHATGLFSNQEALSIELEQAGLAAHDRAWPLPLWDDYQSQLDSNFADIGNIGGRPAGSITAACFLSRFTKAYTWAHLDIAGTAWKSGKEKGSTGRPVPLLTHFLAKRANKV